MKHFSFDSETGTYVCQVQAKTMEEVSDDEVPVCGDSIKASEATHGGTRAGNLKRHLQRFH